MEPIEISRYRYSRMNPFAPPDRRYRIAKICVDYGCLPSYARDDKPTWALWRFLRRLAACEPIPRARWLAVNYGLAAAMQMHHGKLRSLRHVAEAYILAGADDAATATRLAVSEEAVRWYRLSFYDVERLRQGGPRVLADLIGVVDEDGQSALDAHRLWKLVGYKNGPEALDELFGAGHGDAKTFQQGDLAAWLAQQTEMALKSKQLIAANKLDADNPRHAELLVKLSLQERRGQRPAEDTPLNQIERHVAAMLGELPWCHGAAAEEAYAGTDVGEWDKRAAELRDEELMLLSAGKELPNMEEIKALTIPAAGHSGPKESLEENAGK